MNNEVKNDGIEIEATSLSIEDAEAEEAPSAPPEPPRPPAAPPSPVVEETE